ncbi:MAG: ABC transporter ATP-binding protein [Thermoleophilia bacterium]|nr:ABC transporter ATP-binding protein [Thermoleophilia bacterium]
MSSAPLLEVTDLRVVFETEFGPVTAVDGVSFVVEQDSVLGVVGESGAGKSVMMMGVMGLIADPNVRVEGDVRFRGRDLLTLGRDEWREIRGAEVAMIFQDPMTSMHPAYRVGWQIAEQLRAHEGLSRRKARTRVLDLLQQVGIPDPEQRIDDYPHQFSGGQRQRLMIAMALSCRPQLLIADEPTTALDVTIQAQILDLIRSLAAETGASVVLITHDLGVVAEVAQQVQVMYDGQIVESGTVEAIFGDPRHPYTWGLLGSMPRVDRPRLHRLAAIPGAPPAPHERQPGCVFAPRCAHVLDACGRAPALVDHDGNGHLDACLLPVAGRALLRAATADADGGDGGR